jgi:hypothetical protein
MSSRSTSDWPRHIDQILRSRHYTWLGEGHGGRPVPEALVSITTDIMHLCRRAGLSVEDLVRESRERFEDEERELAETNELTAVA